MLYQRDDVPDDAIDVEQHLLNVGLVRKRPDVPDHLARPGTVVYNPFCRAACGGQVGSFAVQPAQTGLGVGDDSGERLIHFMGYGGCEFAQCGHATYVCEFHLRFAQRLFGVICADYCSNVGAGAPIAEKISLCVENWLAACPDIYRRSTLAYGAIHKIAKWLMCVERVPLPYPFL